MGAYKHLNYDRYRRDITDIVDEYPELAVAHVTHDIVKLYRHARNVNAERLVFDIHYDIVTADISDHEWDYMDDGVAVMFENIRSNPPDGLALLADMDDDLIDWVGSYDAWNMRTYDLDEKITSHNDGNEATITFPNKGLAVVWLEEILGQISDGAWENAQQMRHDGWKKFYNMDIDIDESQDVVTVENSDHPNIDVSAGGKLGEYDALLGRALYYVKATVNPDYELGTLKADLDVLNNAL